MKPKNTLSGTSKSTPLFATIHFLEYHKCQDGGWSDGWANNTNPSTLITFGTHVDTPCQCRNLCFFLEAGAIFAEEGFHGGELGDYG